MKIAYVMLFYEKRMSFKRWIPVLQDSHRSYCDKHGYDFLIYDKNYYEDSIIGWSKIPAMRDALSRGCYDWIFWCDADTLIYNKEISLESFVMDSSYDFVTVPNRKYGWHGSGAFLVRSTRAKEFFDVWESYMSEVNTAREGDSMSLHKAVNRVFDKNSLLLLPGKVLCSHPGEENNETLVIHFPGRGKYRKMISNYCESLKGTYDEPKEEKNPSCNVEVKASNYESVISELKKLRSNVSSHLRRFYESVLERKSPVVLELGVESGISTCAFLAGVSGNDGHVYSVDVRECKGGIERVNGFGLSGHWTFTNEDDRKMVWDKPVDVLFIDTSHTYEHTLEELTKFSPYVKPDGIIFLHDIELKRHRADVKGAVRDFMANNPGWSLEIVKECYGLGIMKRGGITSDHVLKDMCATSLSDVGIIITSHPKQQFFRQGLMSLLGWSGGPVVVCYDDVNATAISPIVEEVLGNCDIVASGMSPGVLGRELGDLYLAKLGAINLKERGCEYVYKTNGDCTMYSHNGLSGFKKDVLSGGFDFVNFGGGYSQFRLVFGRVDSLLKVLDSITDKSHINNAGSAFLGLVKKSGYVNKQFGDEDMRKMIGYVDVGREYQKNCLVR